MNKRFGLYKLLILISLALPLSANANEFGWLNDLNLKAKTNLSEFKTTLGARFNIGNADINLVISNMSRPADAYMTLRLSELSHHSLDRVINEYKANNGKGWGVMAKNLGIKPGSRAFHSLKQGHDLDRNYDYAHGPKKN